MAKQGKTRREFLESGLKWGLAAVGSALAGRTGGLFPMQASETIPDLVAVKNAEPEVMFRKAISLMGGMERFVKRGSTVVVKPNIGFPNEARLGATTNPGLVKAVVQHCIQAGAERVYVFDNVTMSNAGMAARCYKVSGIEDAAKAGGAMVLPADDERYFKEVKIPGAKTLTSVKVHERVLRADVFINLPILKDHSYTHVTIAMKNLMGVVWDRWAYHTSGLDQCIADFCLLRKPDLNIVDAYRVIMRNGPYAPTSTQAAARDIELKKMLLISRDIVAVDAAAAKVFGKEPQDIQYIKRAHELRIGNMNLNQLKIERYAF